MREIKFRVWDAKLKVMVTPVDIANSVMTECKSLCNEKYLMQFTGLLDKAGKEIYEGDIIKLKGVNGEVWAAYWFYDKWCLGNGKEGVGGFQEDYDNGDYYNGENIDWGKTEIIGNIHETPELLA